MKRSNYWFNINFKNQNINTLAVAYIYVGSRVVDTFEQAFSYKYNQSQIRSMFTKQVNQYIKYELGGR